MGSAYHAIHHTRYRDNYGQYLVLWDALHGTLDPPPHRKVRGGVGWGGMLHGFWRVTCSAAPAPAPRAVQQQWGWGAAAVTDSAKNE